MWRKIQRESFTDVGKLADFLELDQNNRSFLLRNKKFPLLLPRRLAEKISKNSLDDPLARQFLPVFAETHKAAGFALDPVSDASFQKASKLLHKYQGRALLIACGGCAMNCRYCFRQNFSYEIKRKGFDNEIAYLKSHRDIHEVILSGGDPLNLSDESLKNLFDELSKIDHIKIIRFHTRFPIGIPERITNSFISLLKEVNKQIIFVIHTNHARELDDDVLFALQKIRELGIPILSQSVLLYGVNDKVDTLKDLFFKLIFHGIIPYYLHQLDQVEGATHFEVSPSKGLVLLEELRKEMPGYAIPSFVCEIPGKQSKTQVTKVTGSLAGTL